MTANSINWKRFLGALFSSFLLAIVFDILINAILLRQAFVATRQYWRPPEELEKLVPVGFLAMLLSMAAYGILFVRFGGKGIREGLEFGFWVGTALFVGGFLGMASLVPWPLEMIAAWTSQQFVNYLIMGVMFGWLYKHKSIAAGVSDTISKAVREL